jgi:hypothetical protein
LPYALRVICIVIVGPSFPHRNVQQRCEYSTVYGENPSGAQAGVNRSRWTMQLGAMYRF